MLTQLTINNFAIVRELEIDFQAGMSVITGETGAGKSIAIDALGLCLGNRGDASIVRQGANRADLCARFSLKDTPAAQRWLIDNQLDEQGECLLRRVINSDGRSRAFINGTAVPISQLRELGQCLIQIHGQHAHQLLLKPEHQKQLLDAYMHQPELLATMRQRYQTWHQSCLQLAQFQQQNLERQGRMELLQYQLHELDEFSPQPDEYETNDAEYKRLANGSQLLNLSQQTLQLLSEHDEQNLLTLLHSAQQQISELAQLDQRLTGLLQMLEEASIQISEASDELRHYAEQLELDPIRLYELEQRLARQLALARKHKVAPETLPELYATLQVEYQSLQQSEENYSALQQEVEQNHAKALVIAQTLSQTRRHYAEELAILITDSMRTLAMPHGLFAITIEHCPDHLQVEGIDRIEFSVTTNPGQPLQPLNKVASGGELSRIALAIQVITAQKMETPALIFDEVDVGISGPTAMIVGKLLRQLGESTQVMCVTHLPQVAGCGHHHFMVNKQSNGEETETTMLLLTKPQRLQELARLLGGDTITKNTLANAKELLAA